MTASLAAADAAGRARPRWLGVGSSGLPGDRAGGAEAARRAVSGADVRLLVVFCSIRRDPRAVLAGIRDVAPGVPLVGASSGGEITADGPAEDQIVVTAFGGDGFTVRTGVAEGVSGNPRGAGVAAAGPAAEFVDRDNTAVLLFTNGIAANQELVVAGAYSVLGAGVPLIGGAACPDPAKLGGRDLSTFQLCGDAAGDAVYTDAVVSAAIASDGPFGLAVRHGFRKVGEGMIVTRSSGGRIYTLDDKPALPAYLDRLGAPAEAYHDRRALAAFTRTRPMGVRRRAGEEVRHVGTNCSFEGGWLGCTSEVPEGGVLWPMEGDATSMIDEVGLAWRAAVDGLGGEPPIGFLAFDCVLRGGVLRDRLPEEVARMADAAAGLPVAGFYTWGEICRTRGVNGFHHQSLALLAVG